MRVGVYISTDKELLDIDFVHAYIGKVSYWGKGRSLEQIKKTIKTSFCFGMYTKSNKQIGFVRVVTDFVFFGNIMDAFIDPQYQGKGLGKLLMDFVFNHDGIKNLQTITLKTKDAHAFYEKYRFQKVGDSPFYMARDKQKLG